MNFAKLLFFLILVFLCSETHSQEFNPSIDKDSLFNVLIKNVHPEKVVELSELYSSGNSSEKEFLLFMLYMPRSSKAEMISNLEKNREKIVLADRDYAKLVPKGYSVYVEFNPADRVIQMPATIDLHIYGESKAEEPGGWRLEYGSTELQEALNYIGWNDDTLKTIKKLLDDAGCISIKNGPYRQIGFARSGMGKYSYRLLEDKPVGKELAEYNDGCMFQYYKDNVVLEYGGGAVGPQCFPD